MYTVKMNQKVYEYNAAKSLYEIKEELGLDNKYCARINNCVKELDYRFDFDAHVEFLGPDNTESMLMYRNTLRYIIIMAIYELNKKVKVLCNYSISRSLFFDFKGLSKPLTSIFLEQLDAKVKEIISKNYRIKRVTVTKEEAMEIYQKFNFHDKFELLKYRPEEKVHLYECNGYYNYMFGYMLPYTSFIQEYKMRLYSPGILVQYPRSEANGTIPIFEDANTFSLELKQSNKWGHIIKASNITDINRLIEKELDVELINLCETKHNNMLADLGDKIVADIDNIRLIAIAGPSSSGKTTFSNRLRIELMSKGIRPIMISIDDYYLPKSSVPKDEFGQPDLEHIEALDIERFNKDIYDLVNGEEVTLPKFDFTIGKRIDGEKIKVASHTPIIIEGIHALNNRLTQTIPNHQRYKIYIAPHVQLHIDDHSPISMTDIRLLRRIVRDKQFRNCSCEDTIRMWPSVRRGEFKWIYPNQEGANYVFNSELTYELSVLKKYAQKQLEEVSSDSECFAIANRLLKFLKLFKEIDDKWIPCNSLIREFIGGSSFYKK